MNACQILADKARPIYPQFALSDRLQVRSTPLSLTTHPAVVRSNTAILRYGRYGYCRASSTISAVEPFLASQFVQRQVRRSYCGTQVSISRSLGSLHQLGLHSAVCSCRHRSATSATPMEPTPSARSWPSPGRRYSGAPEQSFTGYQTGSNSLLHLEVVGDKVGHRMSNRITPGNGDHADRVPGEKELAMIWAMRLSVLVLLVLLPFRVEDRTKNPRLTDRTNRHLNPGSSTRSLRPSRSTRTRCWPMS